MTITDFDVLTAELDTADADHVQRVIAALNQAINDSLTRAILDCQLNGHIGPIHHPTRVDLWAIDRPLRRRRMLRRYLNTVGHPAGQWIGRR